MTETVEVRRCRTTAEAEQRALVLAAAGIDCRLVPAPDGIALEVPAGEAGRAGAQLAAYERENAPTPAPPPLPAGLGARRLDAAIAYGAVIVVFFVADRRGAFGLDWPAIGAAQAGAILDGAWWRTLTALTLHADLGHLINNLVFGAVAGVLLARLVGTGLAWLAIVAAGALGNALNAALQPPEHAAVGASTALFGALGVLSGYTQAARFVPWARGLRPGNKRLDRSHAPSRPPDDSMVGVAGRGRGTVEPPVRVIGIRRWTPVAAGIMLLAFLGFGGERTDIGAHVAGFGTGAAIGYALARALRGVPPRPGLQRLCGGLACGAVALAWLRALAG